MKTECAKIRNIICSASMMILLCVCGGCAAKQEPVADTQQSVEMQSKPLSVLSSESDSMENPELNPEPDEEQETGQEELPEERQDSPPALELVALDADALLTQELLSGNYSWNYGIGEGMMTSGEACGPSPLDEAFYKNQTRNILRYTDQQKQMGIKYEAVFSVMPDSLVVEEWSIDCLGTQAETEAERTTYDVPPFTFEFERDRIYQVTAFWNEADWQERGFYGNASYAFLVMDVRF